MFKNIIYKNQKNSSNQIYEMIERTTKKSTFSCDGVEIIPILKRKNMKDHLVLIANYRPPVDQFVLEFPSGLLDTDNIEENAFRELKEETGYVGEKIISYCNNLPPVYEDPWKSTESEKIVKIEIDGNKIEN